MKQFNYIFLLMALSLATQAMQAQDDSVKVRLVTFYPGSEVFSVYGHSENRIWKECLVEINNLISTYIFSWREDAHEG